MELDNELLLAAHDASGVGREITGLSSGAREFLQNKDESGAKEEAWARLVETTGFSIGRI